MKKRYIGVIIDSMDGEYQRNITEHLIRAAISRDVKLLFFGGSSLEVPDIERVHNRSIFGLANTKILDGIIIVPSTMIHNIHEEALLSMLTHLEHAPVVSIGMSLKGAHAIKIDNNKATKTVFKHMMSHYDLEDICYISGPMKNHEAKVRFEAWLEVLEENGLVYNSDRYYEGNFYVSDGKPAVDHFISKLGKVPKAIVAANDEMAIGVYKRLSQLGYYIPEDVGIAGFDNIERTSDFFPPITTYDQSLDVLCKKALDAVEQLINKTCDVGEIITEGELIVRESCGCENFTLKASRKVSPRYEGKYVDASDEIDRIALTLMNNFESVIVPLIRKNLLPSDGQMDNVRKYSNRLVTYLVEDLRQEKSKNLFGQCLNQLISYSIATEGKNTSPIYFLEQVELYMMDMTSNRIIKERLDDIVHIAGVIINAGVRRREENYQYNFRRMYLMSRSVVRELNGVTCNEDIFDILRRSLPYYGISHCYMVLYKRPLDYDGVGRFIYPMMSDMVFSYTLDSVVKTQSFVTNNMLPTQLIHNDELNNLLFLSLDVGRSQFGYITFSTDGIDYTIYETIRSHVSEALKRHQMNMKRLEAERALNNVLIELERTNDRLRYQTIHDDLTGLYNRRGFYSYADAYYEAASQKQEQFSLIFGDIDGLKVINDNYGHDEGDYAIRFIAKVLKEVFGDDAIVGRMSGDEFTALIKKVAEPERVDAYIANINRQLSDFNESKAKPYDLNISIGYASYDYDHQTSMDDLLLNADKHMYRVKDRKKSTQK